MLDRASTFADSEIVDLLKTRFVPVAIDQAYQRRQKDTEGDFYRKIAGQANSNKNRGTTQGFYIATAGGDLLLFNNNRHPEKVRRLMREKLDEFASLSVEAEKIETESVDQRFNPRPPDGGLVLRTHAKVLGGYEPTDNRWQQIFQNALSRDNLWVSAEEHRLIASGKILKSLQQRIARFHLVDNTRGEPPMWRTSEIRHLEMDLDDGQLTGRVHLETDRGDRGYQAVLRGKVDVKDGKVVGFTMIANGEFWGEGRYTGNAPPGRFPLAISFTLADGTDPADTIPPQGSRGWVEGYLK